MSQRGRLVLKGHGALTKNGVAPPSSAVIRPLPTAVKRARTEEPQEPVIVRTNCKGTILSSHCTVTGVDTLFLSQLQAGDVIEAGGESRPVKFIVSNTSLSLAEPFSKSFSLPVPFVGVHLRDPNVVDPAVLAAQAEVARRKELSSFTGTETDKIQMKKEKGSSGLGTTYVTKQLEKGLDSREDLLLLRSKQKGDKFC
jgi:hypothetical protein